MDPLSILAGGAGLADISVRLINFLNDIRRESRDIEDEIDCMIKEVQALKTTEKAFQKLYELHRDSDSEAKWNSGDVLWKGVEDSLQHMRTFLEKLELQVLAIGPKNITGRMDALRKTLRKRDRGPMMRDLRSNIAAHQKSLDTLLLAMNHHLARDGMRIQGTIRTSVEKLVDQMRKQNEQHENTASEVASLLQHDANYNEFRGSSYDAQRSFERTMESMTVMLRAREVNKHFDAPDHLATNYVGREAEQSELANHLIDFKSTTSRFKAQQRRFVISGIPGSGKTQFCCKFADDYRELFWAVFSVNGQSSSTLKHDLAQKIGRAAKYDHVVSYRQALHWLSNQEANWLLIVDNLDDPDLDLAEFLPKGTWGHILITTRTSKHREWGNVGCKFYDFAELKEADALALLLREANAVEPWEAPVEQLAKQISHTLGYLALAITRAGAAIRNGFCSMSEYLTYYDEERSRFRTRTRRSSSSRDKSRDASEDRRQANVETTYELNYHAIQTKATSGQDALKYQDAIQLLHLFAFLNRQGIRLEYLQRAVSNICAQATQRASPEDMSVYSWVEWSRLVRYKAWGTVYHRRLRSFFPEIIRSGLRRGKLDMFRARKAMNELVEYAFISQNTTDGTYSFHNLAQTWAREMPDLDVAGQGRWVEAASALLAACVILPPAAKAEDEELQRELLFHVDSVVSSRDKIQAKVRANNLARCSLWPIFEGDSDAEHLQIFAKFGWIYAHNARWDEAKVLFTQVRSSLMTLSGHKLDRARIVTVFLATICENLTHFDESRALLQEMADACETIFGKEDPHTMTAQLKLGQAILRQGRASDAKAILERVVEGLRRHKLYGPHHATTLEAMDILGDALRYLWTRPCLLRARNLHRMAIQGFTTLQGAQSLSAIAAQERLCITAIITKAPTHLEQALAMIIDVVSIKKARFGFDHPHTLYARLTEAQIRCELGQLEEAEKLYSIGLPTAERSIGPDHVGYLLGQAFLGKVFVQQGRFREARDLLIEVSMRQKRLLEGLGQNHPDRISTLITLAAAYKGLDDDDNYARIVDEAIERLERITRTETDHPLTVQLRTEKKELQDKRMQKTLPVETAEGDDTNSQPAND